MRLDGVCANDKVAKRSMNAQRPRRKPQKQFSGMREIALFDRPYNQNVLLALMVATAVNSGTADDKIFRCKCLVVLVFSIFEKKKARLRVLGARSRRELNDGGCTLN